MERTDARAGDVKATEIPGGTSTPGLPHYRISKMIPMATCIAPSTIWTTIRTTVRSTADRAVVRFLLTVQYSFHEGY
jgi:hypothetical protein